jgi:uncharacterized DUF497 family protein
VDIQHSCNGLRFEWDQEKARTNLHKHGVSFEAACEVFFDPMLLLKDAGDPDGATQAAVGETVKERLLYVVHILRQEESIRIVSARPVTSHERREYEG